MEIMTLASAFPAAGNTEQSTYIMILVIAGALVLGAIAAGVLTKKKK